jgi:hypothetical protein
MIDCMWQDMGLAEEEESTPLNSIQLQEDKIPDRLHAV